MSGFGKFPIPGTAADQDADNENGNPGESGGRTGKAAQTAGTAIGPGPFTRPPATKKPSVMQILLADAERSHASLPPEEQRRRERNIQNATNTRQGIYDIETTAKKAKLDPEDLIAMGWYDADGKMTREGLNRLIASFFDASDIAAAYRAKRRRDEEAIAAAARPRTVLGDGMPVTPEILAGFEAPQMPYKDRYKGPPDDRMEFIRRAAWKYRKPVPKIKDPLKAVARSARPGHEDTTLIQKTYDEYLTRGRTLDTDYRNAAGIPVDFEIPITMFDFAAWLVTQKTLRKWAPATWRHYRAAVSVWVMTVYEHRDLDDFLLANADVYSYFDSHEERGRGAQADGEKREKRTSAKKKKFFPRDDLRAVIAQLTRRSRSKYAETLHHWLIAGIFTGLRPIEWRTTYIEEGIGEVSQDRYCWLYVLNAKATNGRANGILRTIDISTVSPTTLKSIRYMSEIGFRTYCESPEAYDYLQRSCAQLLTDSCKQAFRKKNLRYSLYSCRHQFIANCKSMMYSCEEISALAGHRDIMVAMEAYGRRQYGWPTEHLTYMPKPSPQDVHAITMFSMSKEKYMERYRNIVDKSGVGIPQAVIDDVEIR